MWSDDAHAQSSTPPASPAASAFAFSTQVTTTGIGVGLHTNLSSRLHMRVSLNDLPAGHNTTVEQDDMTIQANGRIRVGGLSGWLEWFPFGENFHLTGGVLLGSPGAEVLLRPSSEYVHSPRKTFSPDKLGTLRLKADYSPVNPYLGMGWGNALDDHWSLMIDVGMYYIGSPTIEMEGSGLIAPTVRQAERIEEGLQSFQFLPHFGLSFSYRP